MQTVAINFLTCCLIKKSACKSDYYFILAEPQQLSVLFQMDEGKIVTWNLLLLIILNS